MNIFDFGAFRKKMHIPSHDKFLFHMLFGAFHVTPRIIKISIKKFCLKIYIELFEKNKMRFISGMKPYKIIFVLLPQFKYRMDQNIANDISVILLLTIQTNFIQVSSKIL